jgi:hypothetical protein
MSDPEPPKSFKWRDKSKVRRDQFASLLDAPAYVVAIPRIIAAAVAGYFSRELVAPKKLDVSLPFPDPGYSPSTFDLGCTVITEGSAYENPL